MAAGEHAGAAGQGMPVPPWRKARRPATPPKQPLSQEIIVETAIRVLDAEGLDAVSMRRIAQELGTGPASLYVHVSNKDELLELMIDKIAAEIEIPKPDPERWQEQIKESARNARAVFTRHRDITLVSLANVPTGYNQLSIAEGMLEIMRAGRVPDQIASWFVDRMGLYIDADCYEGALIQRKVDQGWDVQEYFGQIIGYFASLPPDRFPRITSMVDRLTAGGDDERFEFGLDLLVRGLASYVPDPE